MKAGSIDALSIGYRPTKVSFKEIDGEMVRILEGIDLREISFITKGYQADSGALLTNIKRRENRTEEENMYNALIEAKRSGCSGTVETEITEFYKSKGKSDPFEVDAVISIEELTNLSKSNRVWAIRNLKLSAKASQHLAELLEVTNNVSKGSEGVDEQTDDTEEESKSMHNALDKLIATLSNKQPQ